VVKLGQWDGHHPRPARPVCEGAPGACVGVEEAPAEGGGVAAALERRGPQRASPVEAEDHLIEQNST
jgi:hypothetical protein